jgi:hypothetical protein
MRKNGLRWVTAIHGLLTHLIFVRPHPSKRGCGRYPASANTMPDVKYTWTSPKQKPARGVARLLGAAHADDVVGRPADNPPG